MTQTEFRLRCGGARAVVQTFLQRATWSRVGREGAAGPGVRCWAARRSPREGISQGEWHGARGYAYLGTHGVGWYILDDGIITQRPEKSFLLRRSFEK